MRQAVVLSVKLVCVWLINLGTLVWCFFFVYRVCIHLQLISWPVKNLRGALWRTWCRICIGMCESQVFKILLVLKVKYHFLTFFKYFILNKFKNTNRRFWNMYSIYLVTYINETCKKRIKLHPNYVDWATNKTKSFF